MAVCRERLSGTDDGRSNEKKGEDHMAAVQEEKRNVSNQIEDVKEMIPMLKELSDDEKIYIKGMLAGFQTMRQLGIKTA